MIRIPLIYALFFAMNLSLLAKTELRTLSETDFKESGDFDSLSSILSATGVIQYEESTKKTDCSGARCWVINEKITNKLSGQTGFFIKPDLFLTAQSPDTKKQFACNGNDKTIIGIGFFSAPLRQFKPQYRFKQCVLDDPKLGIAVIQVVKMDGSKANHPYILPLVTTQYSFSTNQLFSVLGYSFEGRLFYSHRCSVDAMEHTISRERQAKYPSVKLEKGAWARLNCLYRTGMSGAPILVYDKGNWLVAGVVSTLMESKGAIGDQTGVFLYNLLAFPKISSIQARLEEGIIQSEDSNEK